MVDYMPLTAAAMLAILAKAETQTATLQQAQRNIFQAQIPMLHTMRAPVLLMCMGLTIIQQCRLVYGSVQQRFDGCYSSACLA